MTEFNADLLKHERRLDWLSKLKSVNRQLQAWLDSGPQLIPSDLHTSWLCFF